MSQASRSASVERRDNYRSTKDYDEGRRGDYGGRSRSPGDRRRSPSPLQNKGNVLYVGNLSRRLNEIEVKEKFEKYGPVSNIQMIKDPSTQEHRGFCFVEYDDPNHAKEALDSLDQKEFDGRKMKVEISKRGCGYDKTPGKYLGHYKSRYPGNGGGRRRSISPYRDSRGGRRYDRYQKDGSPRGGRRYSRERRSRSRSKERFRDDYRDRRRSRSRDRERERERERYRNDGDRYRSNGGRSRSRSRDRR